MLVRNLTSIPFSLSFVSMQSTQIILIIIGINAFTIYLDVFLCLLEIC